MNSFRIYNKGVRSFFFRKRVESHADGNITFSTESITVKDETFTIDTVNTIYFSSFDDFNGRMINHAENKLSDGVNNKVELHLSSGQKITCNFQLTQRYQIRDLREQLIHYHLAGKLDFLNLTAILGIEEYNAIKNFRQTLASYGK
ncbi:hypothetical protein R1T16_15475 [Flavobacterium sp. DG1-102-2]|uniref:hypothetical protein n=1 Tax=Flavobacterium sp. DG1-102-2 TaxID=3081663 RepID=UPI002949317F|nr:hypothetical protein [Flavobacterium sp. DG1-102-2]MDV6169837.1 hypothetical protein [Flavobacterium sp. DG1-102-2]